MVEKKDKGAYNYFDAGYSTSTDALANRANQIIEFYHVPSGKSLAFKAYLTALSDQYSSEWNSENVFGRMDPIQTFKNTSRTISLGWDIPAGSFKEAKENLRKASLLVSMLYPEYEQGSGNASTMAAGPMFKLKFLNLIQDSALGNSPASNVKETGLLGTIGGLTYEPDLESGFFQPTNTQVEGATSEDIGKLFPQTIKFSAEFTVLHQHNLGWKKTQRAKGFNKFPYTLDDASIPQPNVAPASSTDNRTITDRTQAASAGTIGNTGGTT